MRESEFYEKRKQYFYQEEIHDEEGLWKVQPNQAILLFKVSLVSF